MTGSNLPLSTKVSGIGVSMTYPYCFSFFFFFLIASSSILLHFSISIKIFFSCFMMFWSKLLVCRFVCKISNCSLKHLTSVYRGYICIHFLTLIFEVLKFPPYLLHCTLTLSTPPSPPPKPYSWLHQIQDVPSHQYRI